MSRILLSERRSSGKKMCFSDKRGRSGGSAPTVSLSSCPQMRCDVQSLCNHFKTKRHERARLQSWCYWASKPMLISAHTQTRWEKTNPICIRFCELDGLLKTNEYLLILIFFKRNIYLFEREWGGKGQRERIFKQTPSWVQSKAKYNLKTHEFMTWAKTQSQMINWLSHSGSFSDNYLNLSVSLCLICIIGIITGSTIVRGRGFNENVFKVLK